MFLARLTQLDYARAMAFAAALDEASGDPRSQPAAHRRQLRDGEYAVLVRSDLQGRGLGWKLMEFMIRCTRSERLKCVEGQILRENVTTLQMCREFGFEIAEDAQDRSIYIAKLRLQ